MTDDRDNSPPSRPVTHDGAFYRDGRTPPAERPDDATGDLTASIDEALDELLGGNESRNRVK